MLFIMLGLEVLHSIFFSIFIFSITPLFKTVNEAKTVPCTSNSVTGHFKCFLRKVCIPLPPPLKVGKLSA